MSKKNYSKPMFLSIPLEGENVCLVNSGTTSGILPGMSWEDNNGTTSANVPGMGWEKGSDWKEYEQTP